MEQNTFATGRWKANDCFQLLTPIQFKLLKALAKNNGAEMIAFKDFLSENNLGAASSVVAAFKSLTDKDFVYFDNGMYHLNDRFFRGGLENLIR